MNYKFLIILVMLTKTAMKFLISREVENKRKIYFDNYR